MDYRLHLRDKGSCTGCCAGCNVGSCQGLMFQTLRQRVRGMGLCKDGFGCPLTASCVVLDSSSFFF